MEDLKERYYNILNLLRSARFAMTELTDTEDSTQSNNGSVIGSGQQPYFGYDADHEKRRKEQLKKLWERSEEQVS